MDRLLYIATTGASNIDRAQAVHAHNLANVSTTGFRADLEQAEARWVDGDGHPARAYGVHTQQRIDFSEGVLQSTGRVLDVAVDGPGFLTVQTPDGGEAFTRDGAFQLDSVGRLYSSDGFPVMGDAGPVALPPFEKLFIGGDGTITVQPEGQSPDTLVQVDRLKLVNPDPAMLEKGPAGNLVRTDGVIEPAAPEVQVASGFLESSNVSAVNELTQILSLARQFELEVRMMRTAQTNDEAAARLLQIG